MASALRHGWMTSSNPGLVGCQRPRSARRSLVHEKLGPLFERSSRIEARDTVRDLLHLLEGQI